MKRIDLTPLADNGRPAIYMAHIDRSPARRFRCRARIGIASRLRCSSQLWRLCDGTVRIQQQIEVDHKVVRMRRADGRAPALRDLAAQRIHQIGSHRICAPKSTHRACRARCAGAALLLARFVEQRPASCRRRNSSSRCWLPGGGFGLRIGSAFGGGVSADGLVGRFLWSGGGVRPAAASAQASLGHGGVGVRRDVRRVARGRPRMLVFSPMVTRSTGTTGGVSIGNVELVRQGEERGDHDRAMQHERPDQAHRRRAVGRHCGDSEIPICLCRSRWRFATSVTSPIWVNPAALISAMTSITRP